MGRPTDMGGMPDLLMSRVSLSETPGPILDGPGFLVQSLRHGFTRRTNHCEYPVSTDRDLLPLTQRTGELQRGH